MDIQKIASPLNTPSGNTPGVNPPTSSALLDQAVAETHTPIGEQRLPIPAAGAPNSTTVQSEK